MGESSCETPASRPPAESFPTTLYCTKPRIGGDPAIVIEEREHAIAFETAPMEDGFTYVNEARACMEELADGDSNFGAALCPGSPLSYLPPNAQNIDAVKAAKAVATPVWREFALGLLKVIDDVGAAPDYCPCPPNSGDSMPLQLQAPTKAAQVSVKSTRACQNMDNPDGGLGYGGSMTEVVVARKEAVVALGNDAFVPKDVERKSAALQAQLLLADSSANANALLGSDQLLQ